MTILLDPFVAEQKKTIFTWAAQGAATLTEVISGTQLMTGFCLVIDVTGVGGTPTLDVYVQKELPDGSYADIAHATQQTAVSKRYVDISVRGVVNADKTVVDGGLAAGTVNALLFGISLRIKAVIAGTTPSITGTVTAMLFR